MSADFGTQGDRALLSIVTVCRNSATTIEETLASVDRVLANPTSGVEHLVVDGVSRDQTLAILEAHSHPWRRVISDPDTGIYNAMNKGLRLARGEYVWFLNSDDVLHPQIDASWSRLVGVLGSIRPAVLVGEIQMFRGPTAAMRGTRYWRVPGNASAARRLGWHPPHPAFIAKRELLLELGGFDESKRIAADFKLMTQALLGTRDIALFPGVLVAMREGGASNGSTVAILKANRECYTALRELGLSRGQACLGIMAKLTRKVGQKFVTPRLMEPSN